MRQLSHARAPPSGRCYRNIIPRSGDYMFGFDLFDLLKAKVVSYSVWKTIALLSAIPVLNVMAIGFVILMAILLIRELKK